MQSTVERDKYMHICIYVCRLKIHQFKIGDSFCRTTMRVRRRINEMIYVSHTKNEEIFPIRMQMDPCCCWFTRISKIEITNGNGNGAVTTAAVTVTAEIFYLNFTKS